MNILVVYASYSGGTQVVAELMTDLLKEAGHHATLKRADTIEADDFKTPDLIIMGSPSWLQDGKDGQPHQFYFELKEKFRDRAFQGKKFAIFGLGDRDYARFTGGADQLIGWVEEMQGLLVGEPLRLDSFHFKQDESEEAIKTWITNLLKQA